MSRYGDVEAAFVAQLQTASGLTLVKAVPIAGEVDVYQDGTATVTWLGSKMKDRKTIAGVTRQIDTVRLAVLLYFTSGGLAIGDARIAAYATVDNARAKLVGFTPVIAGTATAVFPAAIDEESFFEVDNGLVGVHFACSFDVQYAQGVP